MYRILIFMNPLHRLLNLPHTRNIIINTFGTYLGYGFAVFYIVFLVRVFPPVEFGVLSVLLTFSYLLANIFSFGMPASVYAHVPHLVQDRSKVMNFILSNFLVLSILSGISIFAVYILSPHLDVRFFKTGAPQYQYMYALLGTQMFIWQNFVQDILNASGKFLQINIAINVANLIKAVLLIWLALAGMLGITQVLIVGGLIGPCIVFGLVVVQRRWLVRAVLGTQASWEHIKLRFTATYFLSSQLFQLASRSSLFFVAYFLTRPEVGYFSLSQRVILAVITSADSVTQVMSAQFAKAKTWDEAKRLFKHSFTYMLLPTAMFVGGILMPAQMYNLVFGQSYAASTPVTKALSFAYLPFPFLAIVMLYFLYTRKKPVIVLGVNALMLMVVVGLQYVLVPQIGLFGPAVATFAALVAAGGYLGLMLKNSKTPG